MGVAGPRASVRGKRCAERRVARSPVATSAYATARRPTRRRRVRSPARAPRSRCGIALIALSTRRDRGVLRLAAGSRAARRMGRRSSSPAGERLGHDAAQASVRGDRAGGRRPRDPAVAHGKARHTDAARPRRSRPPRRRQAPSSPRRRRRRWRPPPTRRPTARSTPRPTPKPTPVPDTEADAQAHPETDQPKPTPTPALVAGISVSASCGDPGVIITFTATANRARPTPGTSTTAPGRAGSCPTRSIRPARISSILTVQRSGDTKGDSVGIDVPC